MNAEVGLISKIIETGDFTIPTDMQITQRYFSGRNKKAFKFIQQHVLQYGNVPSKEVFESKLPSFKLEETAGEGLRYYCDEVRNKLKHNTIVDAIEGVSESIEKLESEEAYDIIKKLVLKIENEVILSDRVEVNKNTEQRLQDYKERARSGGITGIPSGIDRLDHVLKGFHAGELIAFLGYTGLGKTWFLLIIAVWMAKQGYKIVIFTTEMSTKMMIRRIDAIWCKLSYSRFTSGTLTPQELAKYEKYLNSIEGDTDSNLIVEQATGGVSQIGAKIDQHQPDVAMVDGAYLLEDDEGGEDDWRGLVRVFRGLHRLALNKKLPILATTQSKDRKVSLETISFAKAISNDCDVVMAGEQDDEMKADKEIKIKFLKIREGDSAGNIIMNWDFHKMDYSTVYIEGQNGNPVQNDIKKEDEDDEEKAVQAGVQVLE